MSAAVMAECSRLDHILEVSVNVNLGYNQATEAEGDQVGVSVMRGVIVLMLAKGTLHAAVSESRMLSNDADKHQALEERQWVGKNW